MSNLHSTRRWSNFWAVFFLALIIGSGLTSAYWGYTGQIGHFGQVKGTVLEQPEVALDSINQPTDGRGVSLSGDVLVDCDAAICGNMQPGQHVHFTACHMARDYHGAREYDCGGASTR